MSNLAPATRIKINGDLINKVHPGQLSPQLITHNDPRSTASEAFRILKTNFDFKNLDTKYKYIAITSSLPGEGKSTTAANFAITLAQSGKRVALIDADLRKPTQRKIFGLKAGGGLTSALVDGIDPFELTYSFYEGALYVLQAGILPPNSSELVGSPRMGLLLEKLGEKADYVIVDCPPTLGLNDSLAVAPHVDGFLLVVGSGKVAKQALQQAKEQLEKVGAKIIGVILNAVTERESRGSYYYYSYGDKR